MANENKMANEREILEGTPKESGIVALCFRHEKVVDSVTSNPYFLSISLKVPSPRPNFVEGSYREAIPEILRIFDDELNTYCNEHNLRVSYPALRRIVVATPK